MSIKWRFNRSLYLVLEWKFVYISSCSTSSEIIFYWPRLLLLLLSQLGPSKNILCGTLWKFSLLKLNALAVEIICQLDATEVFIADLIACSKCFGHHYAHHQELKSIIQWLLPVVFRAVFFKLLIWCGAEDYVSGLQDVAMPIIRSSRVLHSGCCLWYFVLWFSSCWSGLELRVMCPVCRMLLCPSSGAQEYYTVVAACCISFCGFQVVGLVWS